MPRQEVPGEDEQAITERARASQAAARRREALGTTGEDTRYAARITYPAGGNDAAPARLASRSGGASRAASTSDAPEASDAQWTLALTAGLGTATSGRDGGAERTYTATVCASVPTCRRAGVARGAKAGLDPCDKFAPPGRFEAVSLGIRPAATAPEADSVELATAYHPSPPESGGQRFRLVLRAALGEDVTVRAAGVPRGQEALLIRGATGEHFAFSEGGEGARFAPQSAKERLTLVVGTQAFVDEVAQEAAPNKAKLTGSYPNPFRETVTIASEAV